MTPCYTCNPRNPDRFADAADGAAVLRVPARFCGPPGNANGGIATGMLACPALHAATRDGVAHPAVTRIVARIRAGVPLGIDLEAQAKPAEGGYDVIVSRDGDLLLSASIAVVALDAPPGPGDVLSPSAAERTALLGEMSRVPVPDAAPWFEETGDHPIPGCFSCGPDNPRGLHVYPRPVSEGVTCAPWDAAPEFDNGDGTLAAVVLCSALDCSSGICMPVADQRRLLEEDRFFLLGTLDVRMLRVPAAGARYRVVARALAIDGRKFFGVSALFDDAGTAYAMAEATWVIAGITRTQAFGGGS